MGYTLTLVLAAAFGQLVEWGLLGCSTGALVYVRSVHCVIIDFKPQYSAISRVGFWGFGVTNVWPRFTLSP